MAEKEYKRLTRARMRRKGFITAFATRSSLWLGKDHLLAVDSTGYTEEYKRFYFRDIQAITLVASQRRIIWNWVLGVFTVICVAGWSYGLLSRSSEEVGALIAGTIVTLIFAVPLFINNFLGRTCTCHLRTAVQTEELPSLSRVRRAHAVFNRIRPLIAAAQGQLAPEEIPGRMRELIGSPATATVADTRASSPVVDDADAPPRMVS